MTYQLKRIRRSSLNELFKEISNHLDDNWQIINIEEIPFVFTYYNAYLYRIKIPDDKTPNNQTGESPCETGTN